MTTMLLVGIALCVAAAGAGVLLQRPEWSLVLLCLIAPVGLTYLGAAQVITVVAILTIGIMIVSRWTRGDSPFPPIALSGAILFWTMTVLLSVVLSPYPMDTALFGGWLIVAGLLALAVPGIADTRARLRPVVWAWLLSALLIVVVGPMIKAPTPAQEGETTASHGGAVIIGRATSVFGQPNEYGVYCMMLLLVCIAILVGARGRVRWLAAATAVATATGLVQSYSRGAWIGAVVGLLVLLLIDPRCRKPVAGAVSALVIGGMIYASAVPSSPLVALVGGRIESILNPASNPDDNRPSIVAEGVRQFGAFPMFGVGPNGYPIEGATSRSLEQTVGGLHAHNTVLTVAAEQGLFGVAAMLSIMAVIVVISVPLLPIAVRRMRGSLPEPDWVRATLVGTIAALSAIMISGMVDSPLRNALMRTTLWFTIGLAVAAAEVLRGDRKTDPYGSVLSSEGSGLRVSVSSVAADDTTGGPPPTSHAPGPG